MGLVIEKLDIRSLFESNWMAYIPAILEYGATSNKKEVKEALRTLDPTGKKNEVEW